MLGQIFAREFWEYDQVLRIESWELVATPVLFFTLLILGFINTQKKIHSQAYYKYYMPGLTVRLFAVLFFCFIYVSYYGGGDTISYFESSKALAKLFLQSPEKYFHVMISAPSAENRSLFNDRTGFPWSYLYYDPHTFIVVKLTSVFTIITGRSYLLTSLLLSYISYSGTWLLFKIFRQYAPPIERRIAFAILFFPSVLFWGTGVSKDTYTYAATALFVYGAHEFFITKKYSIQIALIMIFSAWLIVSIKPYIFLVLFPGGMLWIFYDRLARLKNPIVSFFFFPIALFLICFLSYFVLTSLGSSMSKFSLDNALETASVTNYDLKQDYYSGSSFDIGDFDGTVPGMLKLFLPATNAGLFRPYLWEGRSIVLLLAGFENFFLLSFTIYVLFKTKIKGAFKIIANNSLILFCVTYSILFAFMIGLTTSNFGALVRFKIPLLPFFCTALFMIEYLRGKKNRKDQNREL
jgi:hypothetical protein